MDKIEFNQQKGTHSFASTEISWHSKGKIVEHAMTAEEAIKYANLDFKVEKRPLKTELESGELIEVPDMYSTVRTDTNKVLGVVGKNYTVHDNLDSFGFFDSIVGNEMARYETVGVLDEGKTIFITALLPDFIRIKNSDDIIQKYIILTNNHTGVGSLTCMVSPIRVVCANTLANSLKNCTNRINIRHTKNLSSRLKTAQELMELENLYTKEMEEIFNAMASKKAGDKIYEKIIVTSLADNPKMIKDYFDGNGSTRFSGIVRDVQQYSETNYQMTQYKTTRNTLFGAYNAITGYNQNIQTYQTDDNKIEQNLNPNGRAFLRAQKAFDLCLQYLKN